MEVFEPNNPTPHSTQPLFSSSSSISNSLSTATEATVSAATEPVILTSVSSDSPLHPFPSSPSSSLSLTHPTQTNLELKSFSFSRQNSPENQHLEEGSEGKEEPDDDEFLSLDMFESTSRSRSNNPNNPNSPNSPQQNKHKSIINLLSSIQLTVIAQITLSH